MTLTYVIADLHGRYDLLVQALDQILAREPGTIITLGDYVDRGPQSRQVIERLMQGVEAPWTMINLKGNHEDIMCGTCTLRYDPNFWIANGGWATLLSYGNERTELFNFTLVPKQHLDWCKNLPLYHQDKWRIYVHAGVIDGTPLEEQSEDTLTWMLYDNNDQGGYGIYHVVHGHHQHKNVICKAKRTDLDTCAWYYGELVIGVFDDEIPGGAIDYIEIEGEPHARRMETRPGVFGD